jgi:hypothetical protein
MYAESKPGQESIRPSPDVLPFKTCVYRLRIFPDTVSFAYSVVTLSATGRRVCFWSLWEELAAVCTWEERPALLPKKI